MTAALSYTRRRFVHDLMALGGCAALRPAGVLAAEESWRRTIDAELAEAARGAKLSLVFDGTTAEEFRRWQARFRAKLAELLGPHDPPAQWTVRETGRAELADHVRQHLVLEADGVPSVPVYVLVPSRAADERPAPGVVCVHGHGQFGHHPVVGRTDIDGVAAAIASANYDYGLQFVRRGYVVAAPCLIPFGDRLQREGYGNTDPCAVTFVRMQALGLLPIASNLRDLRWTIDLLQSRPEVDGRRIGCAGLSYGGRMTMLLAAIDDRVRAAAVSGALNLLQERIGSRYSCGSQIIPGLLQYGDYPEIGALVAPRPCVWEVGSKDSLIVPKWSDLFRERLRRAYAAVGAADRLHFDDFEGGHRWNGRVAFAVFEQALGTEIG